MPNPTQYDVYEETILESIAVDYIQETNFVAQEAFPVTPVAKTSGKYRIWPKVDSFGQEAPTERAEFTAAPIIDFSMAQGTYVTQPRHMAKPITDEQRAAQDTDVDLQARTVRNLVDADMIDKEKRMNATVLVNDVWFNGGTSATSAASLDASVNSTTEIPRTVEKAAEGILAITGKYPRAALMSRSVYTAIKAHESIKELISGGATTENPAIASQNLVAAALGLDNLYISDAVDNNGFIVKNSMLLYYRADDGPTAARKFYWTGLGVSGNGYAVDMFRDENRRADIVRLLAEDSYHIVSGASGHLFNVSV